jgi:nicotinate-nucleotide pyrophosphorylase (carboxylating)
MSTPGSGENDLIQIALREDLGQAGDVTTKVFIPIDSKSQGRIVARSPCVVSGMSVAREVFLRIDPNLQVTLRCSEGDCMEEGGTLIEVSGSTRSILSAERTALNFLGHLCGIATLSRRYADEVRGTKVQLLDTRKTTPGWRKLEKDAVKAGGCVNHRMGLYDAVLVKDNHLAALGDLALLPPAIDRIRVENPGMALEIEADTLEQVERLLGMSGINVILLDNMTLEMMRRAVDLRSRMATGVLLEASGGVTLESLRSIAETGVDRISVGALTHSVSNADLSLDLVSADDAS